MITTTADSDRNLLFGVLALQCDLIDAKQFAEACAAWAAAKDQTLSVVMTSRGWLSENDRLLIENLLQRKLARHGGDVHASLVAATHEQPRVAATIASTKDAIDHPDIAATLGGVLDRKSYSLITTVEQPVEARERYKLTTLHAKGGIGQVWVARDEALEREVALKELRPDRATSPSLVARFVREAVITGRLDHPGVVPVYELSRANKGTEGEHPFYTMRFIRGRTLSQAVAEYHGLLSENKGTRTKLLKLVQAFVGVCNTVAFAHDRGVIHRDLKGMNIILGDFGEVILLDWGLAKFVDQPDASESRPQGTDPDATVQWIDPKGSADGLTMAGEVLGTPAYMAPEQASGQLQAIGKQTDVYGLGAILYDILSGRAPFDGDSTQEVLRKVREEMPASPSKFCKSAPGALNAICMKAMAKAPKDRYASVTELAADVQHWIADEPVSAWREPWHEQLRRMMNKHRSGVAGAVAGLFLAIVALSTMLTMQTRANHQLAEALERESAARTDASDQSRQAEQAIEQFYSGITEDVILRRPELAELRKKLLQAALTFYEKRVEGLSEEWRGKIAVSQNLQTIGSGMGRVAALQALLGDRENAIRTRQKQLKLYEGAGNTPAFTLITAWNDLANLQRLAGKPKDAVLSMQKALELSERSLSLDKTALLLADLGRLLFDTNQSDKARDLLDAARKQQEALTKEETRQNMYIRGNLAATYMTLGNVYEAMDDPKTSLEYHVKSTKVLERLHTLLPTDKWYRSELARAENNLGLAEAQLVKDGEAGRVHIMKGLNEREVLYQEQPLNIEYRADLARSYYHLARIEALSHHDEAVIKAIKKAEELYHDIPPKGPEDIYFQACLKAIRSKYAPSDEAAQLADDAMKLLRDGIERGYSNVSRFKNDAALESLRTRPDFQSLIDRANQLSAGTG